MNELLRHQEFEREQLIKAAQEAAEFFYMPDVDRSYLNSVGLLSTEGFQVEGIVTASRTATELKLNGIGMNIPLYLETLALLREGNAEWLDEVSKYTRDFTEGVALSVQTTKSAYFMNGEYSAERKVLHDELISEKFEGLTPTTEPKIVFVLGVPGSGKSDAVKGFLEANPNFMLSDLDSLRHRLLPGFDGTKLEDILATQDEMVDIAYEALDIAFTNNINIVCETTLRGEAWLNFMLDSAREYRKEFVLVNAPLEECFRRAIAFRDRPISLDFMLRAFREGYANLFRVAAQHPEFDIRILENKGLSFADTKTIYERIDGMVDAKDPDSVAKILETMNKLKEVR